MEAEYENWKLQCIEEHARSSGMSIDDLDGETLMRMESRLSYDSFKYSMMQGNDGGELLNYVNSHVIFKAGVDFESKPMLVFCACNLPNPKVVDYDRLLNLIIFKLDEFVESDYTVVLLTSGIKYQPGWAWLRKAYTRLDRKYRKNVKNVYVVHPSIWSKFLFQIFGRIVRCMFTILLRQLGLLSGSNIRTISTNGESSGKGWQQSETDYYYRKYYYYYHLPHLSLHSLRHFIVFSLQIS